MITRFKLAAAVLGFAVAALAIGDASAAAITHTTVAKSVSTRAAGKTVLVHKAIVAHAPHRVTFGKRILTPVRLAHRAPVAVKVVRTVGPVRAIRVAKTVRVVRHPLLQRQALAHRVIVKKTIIR